MLFRGRWVLQRLPDGNSCTVLWDPVAYKGRRDSRFINESRYSRHGFVTDRDGRLYHITDPRNGVRYTDFCPSRDPSRSVTELYVFVLIV